MRKTIAILLAVLVIFGAVGIASAEEARPQIKTTHNLRYEGEKVLIDVTIQCQNLVIGTDYLIDINLCDVSGQEGRNELKLVEIPVFKATTSEMTKKETVEMDLKEVDGKTLYLRVLFMKDMGYETYFPVVDVTDGKDDDDTFTIGKPEIPYVDVEKGNWYYDAVVFADRNDITHGTSSTTFSPNNSCTRAQIVTFLWRANGSPEPTKTENVFTDIKEGDYFYKAVLWAVENKITSGTTNTTFSPNSKCTRAQTVTFLWRYRGALEVEEELQFEDVQENAYYAGAVKWALQNDITKGTSEGRFSPEKACTRAEVVTFLYRTLKNK